MRNKTMTNIKRIRYGVYGVTAGIVIYILITACAPLASVQNAADQVAGVAAAAQPIVEDIAAAEGPRDWFDVAWKIAAGLGVLGVGGETIRRKRKKAKDV